MRVSILKSYLTIFKLPTLNCVPLSDISAKRNLPTGRRRLLILTTVYECKVRKKSKKLCNNNERKSALSNLRTSDHALDGPIAHKKIALEKNQYNFLR